MVSVPFQTRGNGMEYVPWRSRVTLVPVTCLLSYESCYKEGRPYSMKNSHLPSPPLSSLPPSHPPFLLPSLPPSLPSFLPPSSPPSLPRFSCDLCHHKLYEHIQSLCDAVCWAAGQEGRREGSDSCPLHQDQPVPWQRGRHVLPPREWSNTIP